ncbi:MAG: MotA/TolQ/ExbB proton channel family protein [Spirochaetes bacterium]|nr:MotA/TolQ/ExbB proton channel family protein [Spirochaetota bacterium]
MSTHMIDFFQKGGVMVVFLTLTSVFAVAIILERARFFWRVRRAPGAVLEAIRSEIEKSPGRDGIANARKALEGDPSPAGRVGAFLLSKSDELTADELRTALEVQLAKEMPRLEERLTTLNTLATLGPLLGLAGTVVGMIRAFAVMSRGDVASSALAGGISEALYSTAMGLIVAIPCYFAYNTFARRVEVTAAELETFSAELLALLGQRRRRF